MKTEDLSDLLLGDNPGSGRVDYTTGLETVYGIREGLFRGSGETLEDLKTMCRDAVAWNGNELPSIRFAKGLSGSIEIDSVDDIFKDKGLPPWMIDWVDYVVNSANGKAGWRNLSKAFSALEPGMRIDKLTRQLTAERLLCVTWRLSQVKFEADRMAAAILKSDVAEANDVIRTVTNIRNLAAPTSGSRKAACTLIIDSWERPDDQATLAQLIDRTTSRGIGFFEGDLLIRAAGKLKSSGSLNR